MKIYLESYGCTLQKSESAMYVNRLLSEGHELVDSPDSADLSVIGTCVVIKKTENKMVRRIEELSGRSRVRVIGCLTSTGGDQLSGGNIEVVDPAEFRQFYRGKLDGIDIRAPSIWEGIPINQGCTGSCNFCVSRVARGKLVSRRPGKVVDQVRMQLSRGMREVKITSLDTAAYGLDIDSDLNSLVKGILSIDGDFRLRIGMMEPKNTAKIHEGLLDIMHDTRVYRFLHLPVQSGDNRVLEAMNREYTVDTFREIAENFNSTFPVGMLSTDVVVGYHCDDEDSFEKTYRLMEDVRPAVMNITKFSQRPYTKDFNSRPPPSNHIKRWSTELTELHHRILKERLESMSGTVIKDAMVTEAGKKGTSVLRDINYNPIVVMERMPLYEKRTVEIVDSGSTFLVGKAVS